MTTPTLPARKQSRRAVYAAVCLLVLASLSAIFVTTTLGNAETTPLAGLPVPAEFRDALAEGAESCPALTAARLAAQVMEESKFSLSASNDRGGKGVAGLTDEEWKLWQPWQDAGRTDPRANIVALSHLMCDLVGQARVAEIEGDPWRLALAAFTSGASAVKSAGGVPAAAQDYVDRVEGYAAWYALQTEFGGPAVAPTTSAAATAPPTATATPTVTPTTTPAGYPTAEVTAPSVVTGPPKTTAPAPPPPAPTQPQPLTSGALWNEEYHGCLSADKALDGTHLVIAACNGSMVQHWEPASNGTIRSVNGLCMDAANASTADWTPVQVAYCSTNPAQLFTLNAQGQLYSPYANKCVNIHYTAGVGTSIVLYRCLNQSNQRFAFRQQ